jgi:hypothetical protein
VSIIGMIARESGFKIAVNLSHTLWESGTRSGT